MEDLNFYSPNQMLLGLGSIDSIQEGLLVLSVDGSCRCAVGGGDLSRNNNRVCDPASSYLALETFSFSTLACFFTDSSLRVSEVAIVLRLMPLPAMIRSFPISAGVHACRCRSNFLAMLYLGIDAQEPDSRKGTPCEPRGSSRTLAGRLGSCREIASHVLRAKPE